MANRLLERLKVEPTRSAYGLWVTLESPSVTEIAVETGLDWVCVDMEHGHLSYRSLLEHTRATARSATAILVRVPEVTRDAVKRSLDIGVDGVLLPLIRTAAELAAGVGYALYPPGGERGIGGERAVRWGLRYDDYLDHANDDALVIPLIETRAAVENIDAILDVPGVRGIFFGPADLSATCGYLGQWEGPGVADQILDVKRRAAARGIFSGVVSRSTADARERVGQGFTLVGLGSDAGLMIRQVQASLDALVHEHIRHEWF